MKNKLPFKGALSCLMLLGNLVVAQFPYNVTFNSTTAPPNVLIPSGAGTNQATFTSDGLQLTSNAANLFGAVIFDAVSFSPANGMDIEFEYVMYGNGSASYGAGDGLMFFLFDGNVTPNIGARGAGLGYTYNRAQSTYSSLRKTGLAGAYLGVGFDYYGNNRLRRFQAESRVGGINAAEVRDQITLRGAGGYVTLSGSTISSNVSPIPGASTNNASGYGSYNFGYPVLVSKSTTSTATNSGYTLDTSTGTYSSTPGINGVSLRAGGTSIPNSSSPNYRKAVIELRPNALGGFNVTVKIRNNSQTYTVIDKFHYPTSLTYVENANNVTTTSPYFDNSGTASANTTHVLNATPPSTLKMGFAASTGGAYQTHLIRSVSVNLPYRAEPKNDTVTICVGENVEILPFDNDLAYGGLITNPYASKNNIDKTSFQFTNTNGDNLGTTVTTPRGEYTYDATSGIVSFVPAQGFVTGTDDLMYSIKGLESPYNTELYRMPAHIILNVTEVGCVCRNPVTNTTAGSPSRHGITLLKRVGEASQNWPMSRASAHTVLESNSKGFVVSRMANPSVITNPIEGMMIYDTTAKCLKIYSDGNWSCFSKPACP